MPFGDVSTKGRRYPVEVLSTEEVRAMLAECSMKSSCGIRDKALVATMYRGGLRLNEVLSLSVRDVTLEDGTVNVRFGKGGKQRFVAVDEDTVAMIVRWLKRREKLGIGAVSSPLFCTLGGRDLDPPQVRRTMKLLAKKAGIAKRVHPHGLRHSRAVDLVKRGTPLPVIQAAYGHTSLQTTQTYVSHLSPGDVLKAMKRGQW